MAAIRAEGLTKVYGDLRAVDGVSLEVAEGEFVGVLGPNGAGKTTLLELVEGLRRPDGGTVEVLGERVWPRNAGLLPRIGVQLQASAFFERLTAREQIRTFAALYDVSPARADDWLERVGLGEKAASRVEDLSGGQAQRLSIACALVHDPDLVFLDEPTAGMSPEETRAMQALIGGLPADLTIVIPWVILYRRPPRGTLNPPDGGGVDSFRDSVALCKDSHLVVRYWWLHKNLRVGAAPLVKILVRVAHYYQIPRRLAPFPGQTHL